MAPRVRKKVVVKRTMFKDHAISTAIRMMCEGASTAQIADATGHPAGKVRNLVNEVRFDMRLPKLRKDFVEYRHLVLENLQRWEQTNQSIRQALIDMRSAMHDLGDTR